jgi:hypothetical protein
MLVLLLLLEGACVVTLLPTNRVGIRRTRKSETKWGVMYLGAYEVSMQPPVFYDPLMVPTSPSKSKPKLFLEVV